MAVEVRIWCDRCKSRITEDRSSLKTMCGPARHSPPIDLCRDCRVDLGTWLAVPPAEPAAEVARARPPKGRATARAAAVSPA